ncbi:uncharacterized protein LOC143235778 [Tachypleus tridentatus]|uniref:uncharacterized protein LOC143235778 n=1 Tax=Tachypleus tridentatus TaxID=6853 RepID=UPI003FD26896
MYYKLFLLIGATSWCWGHTAAVTGNFLTQNMRYFSRPTPFPIRVVNASEVEIIQRETLASNWTLVTNTTLSDLMNIARMRQKEKHERMKQGRLERIKSLILRGVGMSQEPNVSTSLFPKKVHQHLTKVLSKIDESQNGSMFVEKLQSFYPSCSVPESINRELWENETNFNIYYDVNFTPTNSTIKVKVAKLRLYKNGDLQPKVLKQNLHTWPFLQPARLSIRSTGLTISLYQYRRPLTNNSSEGETTYLYSRIIAANYRGWIDFDVTSSLQYWSKMPEMNYGFKIEVQDSYERHHDPNLFFVNINCTDDDGLRSINTTALESPFPNIEELYPDMGENDSAVFENETFPTLDLRTVEISVSSHEPSTRTLNKRRVKDDEIGTSVFYHDCDVNTEEYILPGRYP